MCPKIKVHDTIFWLATRCAPHACIAMPLSIIQCTTYSAHCAINSGRSSIAIPVAASESKIYTSALCLPSKQQCDRPTYCSPLYTIHQVLIRGRRELPSPQSPSPPLLASERTARISKSSLGRRRAIERRRR